jgi:2-dehydropantoate 2-reductase
MTFLVMGAGAVGSAFGGFLAKSRHEVVLIGREPHMQAIAAGGLRVSGIWGNHLIERIYPHTDTSHLEPGFDAIFISVKSFDTRKAAELVAPLLDENTLLISLQNGIGNVEAIAEATGHPHLLGGRVIFGIVVTEPGAIEITVYTQPVMIGFPAFNRDLQTPGTIAKARKIIRTIDISGIPCEHTDEIEKHLWAKLTYNCALNPLGALHRVHYGALGEDPELKAFMDGVVREIFDVARAKGVELFWKEPEEFLDVFYSKLLPDTYHHRPSMLQDIEAGRPTEIDALCGIVVRYGEETGVPTPLNADLFDRIRKLEAAGGSRKIPPAAS